MEIMILYLPTIQVSRPNGKPNGLLLYVICANECSLKFKIPPNY